MTDAKTILVQVLDKLWDQYCRRVSYARIYRDLVLKSGGRVVNDHIALRTFNTKTGTQPAGLQALARIFEAFGYEAKGSYPFPDKHLNALHYEYPGDDTLPKIFISQLEVDELPAAAIKLINDSVANTKDPLSAEDIELLKEVKAKGQLPDDKAKQLVQHLVNAFSRPWSVPKRSVVTEVNKDSQYAAWTLLHGNGVNHFTAFINYQNVPHWPDLITTIEGLKAAGVPMKAEVEGEAGSKLRQSSSQAVDEVCEVLEEDGHPGQLTWSYAYYELAERGNVPGPDGKPTMFHGFLGQQATNLFEMTKRKG